MSRNRFEFMWRHSHISDDFNSQEDVDNTQSNDEGGDDDEETLVEVVMERVQRDQEDAEMIETSEDKDNDNVEDNKEQEEQEQTATIIWFLKLRPSIDHVREVSFSLIFTLGTILSFDEMMIRFTGRSIEMYRMKNKPITKGYNCFVLATKMALW